MSTFLWSVLSQSRLVEISTTLQCVVPLIDLDPCYSLQPSSCLFINPDLNPLPNSFTDSRSSNTIEEQSPIRLESTIAYREVNHMEILDYEGSVTIEGTDGSRYLGRINGFIQTLQSLEAGLGHNEIRLAYQNWHNATIITQSALDSAHGYIIFIDGSRMEAILSQMDDCGEHFVYSIKPA